MIDQETLRADAISLSVPLYVVAVMAAFLTIAWVALHAWKIRSENRIGRMIRFGFLSLLGATATWSVLNLAARFIFMGTTWSLWSCSFLTGLTVETVIWLYELERGLVTKRRGLGLLGLRLILLVLVLFMLLQPAISRIIKKGMERQVLVLVDDSQSMHMVDKQFTPPERLRVAELCEPDVVKGRHKLLAAANEIADARKNLAIEMDTLDAVISGKIEDTGRKSLTAAVKEAKACYSRSMDIVERAIKDGKMFDQLTRDGLADIKRKLNDVAIPKLGDAQTQIDRQGGDAVARNKEIQEILKAADDATADALRRLSVAANSTDEAFYKGLTDLARKRVDDTAARTRVDVARKVLTARGAKGKSIVEELEKKYGYRMFKFGAQAAEVKADDWLETKEREKPIDAGSQMNDGKDKDMAFRQKTDITAALEQAIKDISPECLAGVLMVTDGQHNGEAGVEAVARRLGAQRSPVCSIVVGGTVAPRDAAVVGIHAPESVYLGDKVGVRADLKLDGLRGTSVKVKLLYKNAVVSEKLVSVPEDRFRTTVKFMDTPAGDGMLDYTIEIEPVEGEIFTDNNKWSFVVAVSNDRTNVLIVENRPRWEFRYLRNLFYGRDKSVHLQYVLLNPDKVEGGSMDRIAASAARKFGDVEATDLPKDRDEWMKFDVIILGDIPPAVLDENAISTVKDCVANRSAMLIVIAGPLFMPHAYDGKMIKELLPIKYELAENQTLYTAPEPMYRVALTPDGRNHTIMQESTSASENAQIWNGLPPMYWRHPITGVKEGATTLAYANPMDQSEGQTGGDAAKPGEITAGEMDKLDEQQRLMEKNALIVAHKYGHGRVMMMNFDSVWRLRYKVGDTYHHRFWGQALRWGVSETLRAGTEHVRLGTDKITYMAADSIHVLAKVTNEDRKPVNDDKVFAHLYQNDKLIVKKMLQFREDSNGMYETTLDPIGKGGRYRLELKGDKADAIMASEKVDKVETELFVETKTSVELSELVADRSIPTKIADLSGGAVAGINDYERLLDCFGPGSEIIKERRDITLWDSWLLLLLIVCVVSCEWVLRKTGGLT